MILFSTHAIWRLVERKGFKKHISYDEAKRYLNKRWEKSKYLGKDFANVKYYQYEQDIFVVKNCLCTTYVPNCRQRSLEQYYKKAICR